MGIAERKIREKEDMRKRILNAAKELFVEKGFEATTLRNIAERVEFSPAALYLYYKNKNEIIYALHQEGFKIMATEFQALSSISHPFERFKELGRKYLIFADDHPDFYDLMFVNKGPILHVQDYCLNEQWEDGARNYAVLYDTILECQKAGFLGTSEPHSLALLVWSSLHGMVMLHINKHLEGITQKHFDPKFADKMFPNNQIASLNNLLDAFLRVFEKGT